jgi:hypothetical protein
LNPLEDKSISEGFLTMATNQNQNIPASPAQRAKPPEKGNTTTATAPAASRPSPTALLKQQLDAQAGSITALQGGMSSMSQQLAGIAALLQNFQQPQAPVNQTIPQQPTIPVAGIVSPRPSLQTVPQQVGIHQSNGGPQPVSLGIPQNGQVIDRSEAGPQSRSDNCACCGQRRRDGTVVVATGEYVPSGMTTAWLRLQPEVIITMAKDNHGIAYKVSGQWLAEELNKRERGDRSERATSVPGFLCGERSSQHPQYRLVSAIMRRATKDEEATQYATRVLRAARSLQNEGYILEE